VTRSFLMLEGDYDVDWEVDLNEHSHATHPHRVPLSGHRRGRTRRPGAPQARPAQHCLSPVGRAPAYSRLAPAGGPGGRRGHSRDARRGGAGRAQRHGG